MAGGQAINAPRFTGFYMDPRDLVLVTDKDDPLYDERAEDVADDYLVADILKGCIIEPVIATKRPDGKVYVVDGRRRVKAAIEARKQRKNLTVSVVLRKGDAAELMGVAFAANAHRKQDDPVTLAKKMARYLDRVHDVDVVGVRFGVSGRTVRRQLKLLDVAPEVQKAVRAGKVAPLAAAELAKLPPEEQTEKLTTLSDNGVKPTVERVKRAARDAQPAETRRTKPTVAQLRDLLPRITPRSPGADTRVDIVVATLRFVLGDDDLVTAERNLPFIRTWLRAACGASEGAP